MPLTSVIRTVKALDSSVTTGAGKTGLAYSDITAKYRIDGGTLTSLTTEDITTLGTYQAPTSAAHIRIKKISDSDPCKGELEIHFHNTQMATGTKLWLSLSASGAAFQPLEVDLCAAGAQAGAIGGLLTAPTTANVGTADIVRFGGAAGTFASGIPEVKVASLANNAITAASINADAITAAKIADGAIDAATFAAGAINAAAIATDAIDADALSADAITEIWAKTMTELSAVPGVTASVLSALTWVFEVSRNKITQTATTQLVKKDDGTTTLATSTVSDDGTTFTRGVFS